MKFLFDENSVRRVWEVEGVNINDEHIRKKELISNEDAKVNKNCFESKPVRL